MQSPYRVAEIYINARGDYFSSYRVFVKKHLWSPNYLYIKDYFKVLSFRFKKDLLKELKIIGHENMSEALYNEDHLSLLTTLGSIGDIYK